MDQQWICSHLELQATEWVPCEMNTANLLSSQTSNIICIHNSYFVCVWLFSCVVSHNAENFINKKIPRCRAARIYEFDVPLHLLFASFWDVIAYLSRSTNRANARTHDQNSRMNFWKEDWIPNEKQRRGSKMKMLAEFTRIEFLI